ncbi:MAG: succinate dehydrogenase assembly factor 2 [Nevskia sp.]|nr:succinate dehydrogenase assembly factor 2 [Nevskia sp.]
MVERQRLRMRCRRGMRELDVLLERYLARQYDAAPPAEQQAFQRLLEREDPELWAWVLGQSEPPPDLADVLSRLRRHA